MLLLDVLFGSIYHNPKWTGSLCLWHVLNQRQKFKKCTKKKKRNKFLITELNKDLNCGPDMVHKLLGLVLNCRVSFPAQRILNEFHDLVHWIWQCNLLLCSCDLLSWNKQCHFLWTRYQCYIISWYPELDHIISCALEMKSMVSWLSFLN